MEGDSEGELPSNEDSKIKRDKGWSNLARKRGTIANEPLRFTKKPRKIARGLENREHKGKEGNGHMKLCN